MSKKSDNDLAVALHVWATKEMNYQHHGTNPSKTLPTVSQFSQICKGQLSESWKWVINNIYSAQTVRLMQGNLMLQQKNSLPTTSAYKVKYGSGEHFNEEKAELLERRWALMAKLRSARGDCNHQQADLEKIQLEVAHVETRYQARRKEIRDCERKSALLKAHSDQVTEEVEKVGEYQQRLDSRVDRLTHIKASDEQCYTSTNSSSLSTAIESASTKCVREACDSIQEFLSNMLQGTYGQQTSQVLAQAKEKLWVKVEAVTSNYAAQRVLLSLTICAHDSSYTLRERTTNIDIKKDADQLRFKYEHPGRLSDLSTQSSVLKSVHQLLEEGQTRQIQRFMAAEKSKNCAWKLESRLSRSQQCVSEYISDCYRDTDADTAALARLLYDTELQISTTQAAIRCLQTQADGLKEKNSLAMREKETLYEKYQKIQDFKKMVDNKQNIIQILVRQNLDARNKLENQQSEITEYIEKSFRDHEARTQSLTKDLEDSVTREVTAFNCLPLQHLMFSTLDSVYKILTCDLSIYRLSMDQSTPAGNILHRVLQALEFKQYQAPEDLLCKVVDLQREMRDMEDALGTHNSSIHTQRASGHTEHTLVASLQECGGEVRDHDSRQMATLLPVLQKRLATISDALTNCLRVKDLVQEWWEQPGQEKVPWRTVDDLSLQQWQDKWTVAVTLLRRQQRHT